ncbi:hypothetical protein RhiirA5_406287 [Rhizophagus irregularis]|uniref:Uncharacterized protein n=1 Tax=Rhizophagus irregularis TaxID=588596 RepID=A0A2I1FC83_9GLOM|nr:hypothetical protein RhiirA5_406287 [Rhizophagus irregularis]PKY32004.1 hypothetical protein RhiirB3_449900 [Rhizophagus irregularis]CAB4485581.1 unnamed protein product [Rhizophagus irregularis]CAB5189671.1 unnamed protein product [Rhizophagus irregularis]CAB5356778.1 unnamed protein product [Rhizophagus irregularis]
MQSDDFCDLFEERYLSDNGDNDVPINLILKISGTKLQINTNVAESCHANENRDGKSLSLEASYKKVTQTSTSSIVNDDLEKEKQKISLREKLELEEKELKLEKERLEILKLKRELGVTE